VRDQNLAAWLLERGADDSPALISDSRSVSRGELRQRAREVSAAVLEVTGNRDRPIVPLIGGASVELIAAHLGVLGAGAVSAPLPPLGDQQLGEVLRETQAELVLAERAQIERLQALTRAKVLALDSVLTASPHFAPRAIDARALAVLLYTSGSTSKPKGVMLSAANVRANTEAIAGVIALGPDDRALLLMPLHYSFGLSVLHTHLRAGGSLALGSAVYPAELLAALESSRATGLPGVPTLFLNLLRTALAKAALPGLRYVMISGGKLATPLIERLQQALPRAQIYLRYGITETTAAASILAPDRADKIPSIGRGLPGAPLLVLRRDGTPVTPGAAEAGEIVVKADSVALGYFGDDASGHFREGAFYTGDVATVDADGYVFVVGREREFIKTAGFRVSPFEVEDVVARLPFVEETAVCGVPHALLGESLICFVQVREGVEGPLALLKAHCAEHLPTFKIPGRFELVDGLPRTSSGKLDRRRLPDLLQRLRANP
jgi:long-chain acyl-CoA synthetase